MFTFAELHTRTPGLDGPTRLAVFAELPASLREQAWRNLRERFDHVAALDFHDWCGGDA